MQSSMRRGGFASSATQAASASRSATPFTTVTLAGEDDGEGEDEDEDEDELDSADVIGTRHISSVCAKQLGAQAAAPRSS